MRMESKIACRSPRHFATSQSHRVTSNRTLRYRMARSLPWSDKEQDKMNTETILVNRLSNLFADTFHVKPPAPNIDLLEEGILDSFQFVELLLQLEQLFNLRIDLAQINLEDLRTIEHIARLVTRNGSGRQLG